MKIHNIILPAAILMISCGSTADKGSGAAPAADETAGEQTGVTARSWPQFNADSAYEFTARQVAMGPRVPGTNAHSRCREYIIGNMEAYGADTVFTQQATVKAFDGTQLPMHNIMARFNTKASRRILIAAHYDTRPWADEDKDETQRKKPIDGANDGASGVAVAMELARNIGKQSPGIGVDFLFTDVEDYGSHDEDDPEGTSWALGSQYWADHCPYTPLQRPFYGILLDMVGGHDAYFYREYFSERYAPWVNAKIWGAASAEGIGRFIDQPNGGVTDDHIFITKAGIPCVDIIECANAATGSFPKTWHTMDDNMENIDRATLGDVGRTLMRVIYTEQCD